MIEVVKIEEEKDAKILSDLQNSASSNTSEKKPVSIKKSFWKMLTGNSKKKDTK